VTVECLNAVGNLPSVRNNFRK